MTCDLGFGGVMSNDFSAKGIVIFLVHSPVNAIGVGLFVGEEELLPQIEGRARELVGTCMEGSGVDGARTAHGTKQLQIYWAPVNLNERGDLSLVVHVGDVEDVATARIFKVDEPSRTWVDIGLWSGGRGCPLAFFLFGVQQGSCGLHVTFDDCIQHPIFFFIGAFVFGREIIGSFSYEGRGRGRERGDRVCRCHGFAIGSDDVQVHRGLFSSL
jgi:hypothetical protein